MKIYSTHEELFDHLEVIFIRLVEQHPPEFHLDRILSMDLVLKDGQQYFLVTLLEYLEDSEDSFTVLHSFLSPDLKKAQAEFEKIKKERSW